MTWPRMVHQWWGDLYVSPNGQDPGSITFPLVPKGGKSELTPIALPNGESDLVQLKFEEFVVDQDAIRSAIESSPAIRRVIHLRTEHLGPEELLVGVKVELDHDLTLPEIAARIDEAEARLRAAVPKARVVYVEPDVARSAPADFGNSS